MLWGGIWLALLVSVSQVSAPCHLITRKTTRPRANLGHLLSRYNGKPQGPSTPQNNRLAIALLRSG
jgi:hypothetical protein